jgi:hypothetical protein
VGARLVSTEYCQIGGVHEFHLRALGFVQVIAQFRLLVGRTNIERAAAVGSWSRRRLPRLNVNAPATLAFLMALHPVLS